MKLLLDTHTLLWHADSNPCMSARAMRLLSNPSNELFLSMATVWEIAIKVGLKKLKLSNPYLSFMTKAINGYELIVLPITIGDCADYETLPFPLPKHRDPFDRLIITHAQRNNLSVVGSDDQFDAYGIQRIW